MSQFQKDPVSTPGWVPNGSISTEADPVGFGTVPDRSRVKQPQFQFGRGPPVKLLITCPMKKAPKLQCVVGLCHWFLCVCLVELKEIEVGGHGRKQSSERILISVTYIVNLLGNLSTVLSGSDGMRVDFADNFDNLLYAPNNNEFVIHSRPSAGNLVKLPNFTMKILTINVNMAIENLYEKQFETSLLRPSKNTCNTHMVELHS